MCREADVVVELRLQVHDGLTECEETLWGQVLGEEVGQVVVGADKWDLEGMFFDAVADEEMTASDVFRALVVFGIVRQVACCRVVSGKGHGPGGGRVNFVAELLEVKAILGGFRESHDLSFGAGESDGLLCFGGEEH